MKSQIEKLMNDKTSLGGRWIDVVFPNVLDLHEKEWRQLDKSCLSFKHWTHICTKHHHQLLVSLKLKLKTRLKK
jgi:hypothetical protein